ncbi:Outer membrane lipoprotein omp16 precursor [hydrothermal vent metagenome]|uniref:Outer membrane lipoprotein omp16 n=1 Tax=hydrothermal vent metagenome TaxID=652676 RepID=A0A1W1C9Q6_9ZZZZ
MKKYKSIVVTGITLFMLNGCTAGPNTQAGTAIGAASGAVLGGVIGGSGKDMAIGAVLGAVAGGAIGYNMDKQANDIARSLGTGVNNDPLAYLDPNQDLIVSNNGKYVKIMFRDKMMFKTNSDVLTNSASYKVSKVAEILKQYPQTIVETAGHTDKRGNYSYNMNLSRNRAKSVSDKLYASGISNHSYITGCSYAKPLVDNSNKQNMALNRRVEIYLYPTNDVRVDACR